MRLSSKKGAHAALSSAARQEIRVRFGRDDKFVEPFTPLRPLGTQNNFLQQNCHLDRSVAQWRDLWFLLVKRAVPLCMQDRGASSAPLNTLRIISDNGAYFDALSARPLRNISLTVASK
jgi:hypothetical protein